MVWEYFKSLDWTHTESLDDIVFQSFMNASTDLKTNEIFKIFDLLVSARCVVFDNAQDLDGSGTVEFDEVRTEIESTAKPFSFIYSFAS